jgi:hypothetical protein
MNCFHFDNEYYKQYDRLAMGAVSNPRRNIHSAPGIYQNNQHINRTSYYWLLLLHQWYTKNLNHQYYKY